MPKSMKTKLKYLEEVAEENAEIVDSFFGFSPDAMLGNGDELNDFYVWNEISLRYERNNFERFD